MVVFFAASAPVRQDHQKTSSDLCFLALFSSSSLHQFDFETHVLGPPNHIGCSLAALDI
jgi:hypothetical protein